MTIKRPIYLPRITQNEIFLTFLLKEFINSPIYPVMIISYEMFLRSVEEVRNIKFGLVICDEAHRLKNTSIKTATVGYVPLLYFGPNLFW